MTRLQETGDLIWNAWKAGGTIDRLPDRLQPKDREEGYAAQAALERHSPSARAGWKIAATSSGGQAHIGVDGPLAGRLFENRLFESGACVSLAGNRMRVAEPEFAFRLSRMLVARAEPYTMEEVLEAVEALHLTLELPDSRFLDFATAGGPALIADNACAHDLVVGPKVSADWRSINLAEHSVYCTVGSRYTRQGVGGNVLSDPRAALTWCVNELSSLGITVNKGELITTGTATDPLPVEPGDSVSANFGLFGEITVELQP